MLKKIARWLLADELELAYKKGYLKASEEALEKLRQVTQQFRGEAVPPAFRRKTVTLTKDGGFKEEIS